MKFTLVSFFNSDNLGDLLISSSLKRSLSEFGEVQPVHYDDSGFVKGGMTIRTGDQAGASALNQSQSLLNKLNLYELALFIRARTKRYTNEALIPTLQNSDALVIGGGNMIYDVKRNTLAGRKFRFYAELAEQLGKPLFAISLGIGPFQTKKQQTIATNALALCDYITFRDYRSLELFKEIHPDYKEAYVVADPAFYLDNMLDDSTDKNLIALNIINPDLFPQKQTKEQVATNYVELITVLNKRTGLPIVIYNTETRDYPFCRYVYEQANAGTELSLREIGSPEELFTLYSQAKLVVGTRMHSLITAYSQGIAILGLSWQQKVDAMFELIEEPEHCFKLHDLGEIADELALKAENIMSGGYTRDPKVLRRLEDQNAINKRIVKSIIGSQTNHNGPIH